MRNGEKPKDLSPELSLIWDLYPPPGYRDDISSDQLLDWIYRAREMGLDLLAKWGEAEEIIRMNSHA